MRHSPLFALLLVIVAVYATVGYVVVADVSLFQILTVTLTVCFGIDLLGGAPIDRRVVMRLVLPFSVFLAACILSVALAVVPATSWTYIRNWTGSLVLATVVGHVVRTPQQLERLLRWLFMITVLGAILAILQRYVSATFSVVPFLSDPSDPYAVYFSQGGLLSRPAGFGKMNFELGKDMLVGVVPAFAVLQVRRLRSRLAAATVLLGSVAIFISGLRSSWLAAAAGVSTILMLSFLLAPERRRIMQWVAAGVVASVIVAALAAGMAIRTGAQRQYSTNLRIALAYASAGMLQDSPLLGVGIGNFKHRYAEYYPDEMLFSEIDSRRDVPTHNVLLEILVGAGPIALLAYLLVQAGAIANCIEAARLAAGRVDAVFLGISALGVAGALVAFFVEYLLHNHMFENHLWLLVGASFAIRRIAASRG